MTKPRLALIGTGERQEVGQILAGGDVNILTNASTSANGYGDNGAGALIAIGDARVFSNQRLTSIASVGSGTIINAGNNLLINSESDGNAALVSKASRI